MSRLIDADALIDGYKHMGYDPNEHPEESYMEGWCKGFNAAVDHCIGHVIHAPTIEPERKTDIIQKFRDYQIDLLKSHYDIELEPQLEEMIVRFLHDTANTFMMEEGESE